MTTNPRWRGGETGCCCTLPTITLGHIGLHRQFLYGGLRIGLYEPVKRAIAGDQYLGDVPLHIKIVSGLATGALAISVASPTDLVKV